MRKTIQTFGAILISAFILISAWGIAPQRKGAKAENYTEYLGVEENDEILLKGAPSVILQVNSASDVDAIDFSKNEKPSNVILTLNKSLDVVDSRGDKISSFSDAFVNKIYKKAIPVVRIEDEETADAFITLLKNQSEIEDTAVISDDLAVIEKVRKGLPKIRGIYDCSKKDLSGATAKADAVKGSTVAMANVIVLSEEQSDLSTVNYFQSRLKTVWTALKENVSQFDVKNAVSSETYGLVVSDPDDVSTVFDAFYAYTDGESGPSVSRRSLNIAHRGLPATMAENSVEGISSAVKKGATHVEIDVHLSKDGRVIVMHDATIKRTTTYSGGESNIANMTLEEIRKYKINKTYSGKTVQAVEIPVLEDVFDALKKKDTVIVLEIKTENTAIVPKIRELIEQYDFFDRVVIISFGDAILSEVHNVIPEIPLATLNDVRSTTLNSVIAKYNAINAVFDTHVTCYGDKNLVDGALKNRGYMSFCWTLADKDEFLLSFANGYYGLTNNQADEAGTLIRKVEGKDGQIVDEDIGVGSEITVVATNYRGEQKEDTATVFAIRKNDGYAEIIASYDDGECLSYTCAFRADYQKQSSGGCGAGFSAECALVPMAVLIIAVVLTKRVSGFRKEK